MGLFEFVKSLITTVFGFIDNLINFLGSFVDGAVSFISGPVTLNTSLATFFFGYSAYPIYALYLIALIALGFMVARIIVNLL